MPHATGLLAVMPRPVMVGDPPRGTPRVVTLPIPAPRRPAGLTSPRGGAPGPAGHAFAACLHAYLAEIAERGLAEAIAGDPATGASTTGHPATGDPTTGGDGETAINYKTGPGAWG